MTNKQWIMRFMLKHKLVFLAGFCVVTTMTLINLSYPFLNGRIINIAFYDKDMGAFLHLFLIYTCILLLNQFVVASLNNLIASHLMTNFLFDIRKALTKYCIKKVLSFPICIVEI